jgi:hypothetical protein
MLGKDTDQAESRRGSLKFTWSVIKMKIAKFLKCVFEIVFGMIFALPFACLIYSAALLESVFK